MIFLYEYSDFLKEERKFSRLKFFSSKGNRFSGDSIESCVDFIDLVDRLKIPDIKNVNYERMCRSWNYLFYIYYVIGYVCNFDFFLYTLINVNNIYVTSTIILII